jgi:MazG family protein
MQNDAPAKLTPPDSQLPGIDQLIDIVAKLRGPGGCPWDIEQTHGSLRAGLLEEAYEVVEAINKDDHANLREELGDLLLQSVFHAQIANDAGRFNFDDVAREISAKLVRRHPHVFGDMHCTDAADVLRKWDDIKRAEKGSTAQSALDGISTGLPALMRAEKVQKKAARVGFDWATAEPVFVKVREELAEVEAEVARRGSSDDAAAKIEDEIGDVLFAAVNLARKLQVDAEVALQRATDKFSARFREVERLAGERGLALEKLSLSELDAIWDEVKAAQGGAVSNEQTSQSPL